MIWRWLKRRVGRRYKTYFRHGYRWFELRIGQRRWVTWQMPFLRSYSIAWTQQRIDEDVAKAVIEGLMTPETAKLKILTHHEDEVYDGG